MTPIDEPQVAPRNRVAIWVGGLALLAVGALVVGVVALVGGFRSGATASPVPRASPATLPPTALASGPAPDVIAQARACPSLPTGTPAAYLVVASASGGAGVDPASGLTTQYVVVTLAGVPPPAGASYTVVVAILPFGATAPPVSGPAIDHAGTIQLVGYWDGGHWYRALRTWSGSAWSAMVDLAAAGVDVVASGATVTLYWQGLGNGDRFGEVTADAGGCSGHDLDPALTPTQAYAG